MSLPFSFIKQNNVEYEVVDKSARNAIAGLNNKHKYIFIGDSYQYGGGISGAGNRWEDGWLGIMATALGMVENTDFYHNEYPGYGFTTNPGFQSLIEGIENTVSSVSDEITDIIVTGGLNDTNGVNSLSTPISDFISYCKAHYPNAVVHIGYLGNYYCNPQLRFDGRNVPASYEASANANGAKFINNSQYLLHDANYFTAQETWHPNTAGHTEMARKMTNYILGGDIEAIYEYKGINFTLASTFNSVEGTPSFSKTINNGLTVIKSQNNLRFRSDNGITVASGAKIKLGVLSANGSNPAISGYTEATVSCTFNNYNGSGFEYEAWPAKVTYEYDAQNDERVLYLISNAPLTLNVYSVWISAFDLIASTSLT